MTADSSDSSRNSTNTLPAGPLAWIGRQPFLLLSLAMLFWAGNSVLGRAVRGEVPPVGLAWWRWVVALTIILAFAWPQVRRDLPELRRHWRVVMLLGCLGIASFNTFLYMGLQHTTAVNGMVVLSTMPVGIVALSFLLFRDRISGRQALGIALSMAGALAVIARGDWSRIADFQVNPGDLLIGAATASYAAYSACLRKRPALHPMSFIAATFLVGALALTPFYVWESTAGGYPMPLSWTALGAVAYVGIFPSILSYLCFNRGVELVGANRAGPFFHLHLLFGALLSIAILGETPALYHGLGLALIVPGLYLASRKG